MAVHHAVGISRQRNSGYRPNRVNIMAQGLSTPDPSVNPTHLSIRGGRATATHYTHHADIHLNIVCYIASEFSFRFVILLFAFSSTLKMQFSKTETISVKSNQQSAKQITVTNGVQNVHRQRSHTLAVEYTTDNDAVLISEMCVSVDVRVSNIDVSKLTIF